MRHFITFGFLSVFLFGCEIPEDDSLYRNHSTHNVELRGEPSLIVEIEQIVQYQDNQVIISTTNLSLDTLNEFSLLHSFYSTPEKNYRDLLYTYNQYVDTILPLGSLCDTLQNVLNIITSSDKVEIVTTSSTSLFSGYYSGHVRFMSNQDSSTQSINETRGAIDSNGNLQLKINDHENVDLITGIFLDSTVFYGAITNGDSEVSGLALTDSLTFDEDGGRIFRFLLTTPFNNSDSIILDLQLN